MFYKVFHPEIFQGHLNKKNYFEGWYFKYVSPSLSHTFAFIPGISLNNEDPHAFIQVFISNRTSTKETLKTYYERFDINAFHFIQKHLKFKLGKISFFRICVSFINIGSSGFTSPPRKYRTHADSIKHLVSLLSWVLLDI